MPVLPRRPIALVSLFIAIPVAAQEEDAPPAAGVSTSVTTAATDAFGERVGINQIGLYSEVQTRGFDLMAGGGSFRIDGHYYDPAATPSESTIAGLSINVGIAATSLELPSPTGVINYRLRDPGEHDMLSVTTGMRDNHAFHVETVGTLADSSARFALAAHALLIPHDERSTGEDGPTFLAGATLAFRPSAGTRLRLFGAHSRSRHDGDTSLLPVGPGLPPPIRARHHYGPGWMRAGSDSRNFGALFEHRSGSWSFGASAIRSEREALASDVVLLEIDRAGNIASTVYRTPETKSWSNSYETKIARVFKLFGAEQRIGAAIRQRNTLTGRAEATGFAAGNFTVDEGPVQVADPGTPANPRRGWDRVNQRIASGTFGLIAGPVELRLGAHANRYEKSSGDFDGRRSKRLQDSWLYSASAIWQAAPGLQLFASHVSGLEESGTAPSAAVNRGEVLPPVKAVQYEAGARYVLTPALNLIAATFNIEKPIYALRPDGLFAPAGTVRHRGVEASLTGSIAPATTLVLGANWLQPRVIGSQVDAGPLLHVAPGVSRFNATLSLEHRFTTRWTLDGYFLWEGGRRRDAVTRTEVPGVPFSVIGARNDITLGRTPLSVRAQLFNPLGFKGYYATPSSVLVRSTPSALRLLAGIRF